MCNKITFAQPRSPGHQARFRAGRWLERLSIQRLWGGCDCCWHAEVLNTWRWHLWRALDRQHFLNIPSLPLGASPD